MQKEKKNEERELDYKRLYKNERIFSWCLAVVMLMLMIAIIVIQFVPDELIMFEELEPKTYKQLNVTYEGLSNSQKENVKSMFDDLNPMYLTRNTNFVFQIAPLNEEDTWAGININDGEKIKIQYNRDLQDMRITLCHEILHSYISEDSGNSDGHKIVYDLADKGVCYG